jgi:Mycothiol maleylpyruvate isomerase N-terminal domain
MTAPVPTSSDLRAVVDAIMAGFARVPDDGWERRAHGLDWDCRDTVAHLLDDFGFYAMNLSGRVPPQDDYIDLLEPPPWREGSPPMVFWPDPAKGTAAIVRCVDATGGLLVAVTATAPPGKVGYHPRGNGDASGFAAMGIVEGTAHAWDVLTAHDIAFRIDDAICERVLNRLFPGAVRSDDPWMDFLTATGRTEATRDQPWTWDSSVRDTYGT